MHSIEVYITKDDGNEHKFPHAKHGGCLVIPMSESLAKAAGSSIMDDYNSKVIEYLIGMSRDNGSQLVYAITDYFGGAGDQEAYIVRSETDSKRYDTINEALSFIGVEQADGQDLFDTVGLGMYRTNNDIINAYEMRVGVKRTNTVKRVLLRCVPEQLMLVRYSRRVYVNRNLYYEQIGEAKSFFRVEERLNNEGTMSPSNFIKETFTKMVSEAEYNRAMEHAYSVIDVYAPSSSEPGCDIFVCQPENASVRFAFADMHLDGQTILAHPVLIGLVLTQVDIGHVIFPHMLGITGNPELKEFVPKPKPVQKLVYECPECGDELQENKWKCACGYEYKE